jgi:hypothetical protein
MEERMRSFRSMAMKVSLGVAALGIGLPGAARAADHRDAPNLIGDPQADLLDAFAFVNGANGRVVLAVTCCPFIVPGTTQSFAGPEVLYQFKIDNTGDNVEDVVVQVQFSKPQIGTPTVAPQTITVVGPAAVKGKKGRLTDKLLKQGPDVPVISGNVNTTLTNTGGDIRVFAGITDDPFFVDFIQVLRTIGVQGGALPVPATRQPVDFFNGLNCETIVVEVPAGLLKSDESNTIRVWATTSRSTSTKRSSKSDDKGAKSFVQVERDGLPVINTALIRADNGARKDEFNRLGPATDIELFKEQAVAELVKINGDQAYSANLVDTLLLPDVLVLDVTSTAGFPNGRRPEDDIIDAVLNAASKSTVTTDGIQSNDVPFLTEFPFFAPAHAPTETINRRN